MTDLPEPMVPAEVDLRDFQFMPLDVAVLCDSGIAVEASGDEFRAAVLLWCKAWHQVPAGSLPDNDAMLSQYAGYGRFVAEWQKVRASALRGFVKCADGRLYHPVVAEKAIEAWLEKLAQRLSSGAGNAKRWGIDFDPTPINEQIAAARDDLAKLNPLSKALSKRKPPAANLEPPPDDQPLDIPGDEKPSGKESRRDSKRDRKGQGQGQGQGTTTHYVRGGDAPDGATTTTPADLISAFDNAIVSVWGEAARRREPHSSDRETAAEWVEAGITATVAGTALRDRFATMKARGNRPPFSMSPFTQEIQWAAAGQAESGPGEPRSLNDDASRWRSRLIGFRDRGAWFPMYGPKPGEPDCEAPAKLIAEVLPELAPAAQIYHYAPQSRAVQ